jgi:hypothetical protein
LRVNAESAPRIASRGINRAAGLRRLRIEKWQRETYPAIARQAKAEGAEIFFWDESGFHADTVH